MLAAGRRMGFPGLALKGCARAASSKAPAHLTKSEAGIWRRAESGVVHGAREPRSRRRGEVKSGTADSVGGIEADSGR